MARDDLGGYTGGTSDDRAARLHADAARLLTARSGFRDALPRDYRQGPAADMLLWLYLHPNQNEARLYRAADLSRSPSVATRWLMALLKDGLAIRCSNGLALSDAGIALLETTLEELTPMDQFPILQ